MRPLFENRLLLNKTKIHRMMIEGKLKIHGSEFGSLHGKTELISMRGDFERIGEKERIVELFCLNLHKRILGMKRIPRESNEDEIFEALDELKDSWLKQFELDDSLMKELGFETIGYGIWKYEGMKIEKWFDASNFLPMEAITIWEKGEGWTEHGYDLLHFFSLQLEDNPDRILKYPPQFRDHMIKNGFPKINCDPSNG